MYCDEPRSRDPDAQLGIQQAVEKIPRNWEEELFRPGPSLRGAEEGCKVGGGWVFRIKTVECGPAETAQTCGNEGRRGSLAEPNQKVASTKVHGAGGGRIPHLFWSTQNDLSGIPSVGL